MGALEASRGRVWGRKASRVAPIPGPTADRGAWAAMAGLETRAAMAEPGIREAMAGLPPRPQPPLRPLMAGALLPPKKCTGESRGLIRLVY